MRINDSGVSFCVITNIVHIVIKVITAGSRCLFAPEQVIGLVSKKTKPNTAKACIHQYKRRK